MTDIRYYDPFTDSEHIELAFLYVVSCGNAGIKPGSFLESLINLCFLADDNNLARLSHGFPVVIQCFRCYSIGLHKDQFPKLTEYIERKNHD